MNLHVPGNEFAPAPSLEAEQALIGACLVNPERVSQAWAIISPDDIAEPIHRRMLETLGDMHADGRVASMEALIAVLGNEEINPGVTMRTYLGRLVHAGINGELVPWRDALETVKDHAQRARLAAVGNLLSMAAMSGRRIADVATEAASSIDDILAAVRQGKRQQYDGAAAAATAMAHMDSSDAEHATTGLTDLDYMLGGWPRGELSIVAARPGMGKSAFALHSAVRAARKARNVHFVSLEMTDRQIGARLLADLSYTNQEPILYEDILNRRIAAHDTRTRSRLAAAGKVLDGLPIHIDEQRGVSIAEIAARARKRANDLARDGQALDVLFVDHIGLVKPSGRYAGNRVREVAEISDGLATLAKELNVAVVGLCQLNRAVEGRENKRPSLSDLRDSGSIEEDASSVTFLYRAAYYLENSREDDADMEAARIETLEKRKNELELVVSKNRNGRVGVVNAFCAIGSNAIRDASFTWRR